MQPGSLVDDLDCIPLRCDANPYLNGIRTGNRFPNADKRRVIALSTLNVIASIHILTHGKDHAHCDPTKTFVASPLSRRFRIVSQCLRGKIVEVRQYGISHSSGRIMLEQFKADKNRHANKDDTQDDKKKLCLSHSLARPSQYLLEWIR